MDKTPEDLITAIRELAAWDPDYVDPIAYKGGTCRYRASSRDDYPGCLVGQAALRIGFSDNEIVNNTSVGKFMMNLFDREVSADQVDWIRSVQLNQDAAIPWAESVRLADLGDSSIRRETYL